MPPDLIVPLVCSCEPIGDGSQVQIKVDVTAPADFGTYLWEKIHDAIKDACMEAGVPIEEGVAPRFKN